MKHLILSAAILLALSGPVLADPPVDDGCQGNCPITNYITNNTYNTTNNYNTTNVYNTTNNITNHNLNITLNDTGYVVLNGQVAVNSIAVSQIDTVNVTLLHNTQVRNVEVVAISTINNSYNLVNTHHSDIDSATIINGQFSLNGIAVSSVRDVTVLATDNHSLNNVTIGSISTINNSVNVIGNPGHFTKTSSY